MLPRQHFGKKFEYKANGEFHKAFYKAFYKAWRKLPYLEELLESKVHT